MRINHNIAALNTYRQLGQANAGQSKSMEKLSSGLRINRAGDDAAGLAISEKMRSQIRGLEQSQRNSQDAISLIQTAEGAMNETHSILQRMRELATQSANGTNEQEDREALQQEMNQLTSEVNRIGNTTEFNKKSLLNGDISIGTGSVVKNASEAYTGTSLSNLQLGDKADIAAGKYETKVENLGGQVTHDVGNVTLTGGASDGTVTGTGTNLSAGSYKIEVKSGNAINTSVDGLGTGVASEGSLTVAADSSLLDASYDVKIDKATTHEVTEVDTAGLSNLQLGTGGDVPADGTYKISTESSINNLSNSSGTAKDNVITDIRVDPSSTYTETGVSTFKIVGDGSDDNTFTLSLEDSVAGQQNSVTFTATASEGVQTVKLGDFSVDLDFASLANGDGGTANDATDNTYHNAEVGFDVGRNITIENNADSTQKATVDASGGLSSDTFNLSNGGGKFTLDAVGANGVTPGEDLFVTVDTSTEYTVETVTDGNGTGTVTGANKQVLTESELLQTTNNTNLDLGNGVQIDLDTAALKASSDGTFITDFTTTTQASKTAQLLNSATGDTIGSKQTLETTSGSQSLAFDTEGISFDYTGDQVSDGNFNFTIEEDTTADDFAITLTRTHDEDGNLDGTIIRNQESIDPNGTYDLGNGATIDTAVNMTDGDVASFEIESGEKDSSLSMQIGANNGQSLSVDVSDMRSDALGISATSNSETIKDEDQNVITGAKWTATKAATDGTSNTKEEFSLDITSSDSATAAIEVLDNAINKVSSERSKLGAFQNRLEHTINNLGTASENLTAAESRVRDVDYAFAA